MGSSKSIHVAMHFKTMVQSDVPQGRNGKHKRIITTILEDLDAFFKNPGSALKIPLADLAEIEGECAFRAESCNPESRTQGCDRGGRQIPVRVERERVTEAIRAGSTSLGRPLLTEECY